VTIALPSPDPGKHMLHEPFVLSHVGGIWYAMSAWWDVCCNQCMHLLFKSLLLHAMSVQEQARQAGK
jgi:hypothetical protein